MATRKTIAGAFVDLLYSREDLDLYRLIIAEQRNFPGLGEVIYRSGPGPFHEQLSSYLTELKANGVLRNADVEAASQLFFEILQGHEHFRCLMGLKPGLRGAEKESIVEAAVPLFLKGYSHED